MSDVQMFLGLIALLMAVSAGIKMWLFFKKPEAYKRLSEYEDEWRAKRDQRVKKAVGTGLQVGGVLWRMFKR